MDLSEKRKQLEAIRAARLAKQQASSGLDSRRASTSQSLPNMPSPSVSAPPVVGSPPQSSPPNTPRTAARGVPVAGASASGATALPAAAYPTVAHDANTLLTATVPTAITDTRRGSYADPCASNPVAAASGGSGFEETRRPSAPAEDDSGNSRHLALTPSKQPQPHHDRPVSPRARGVSPRGIQKGTTPADGRRPVSPRDAAAHAKRTPSGSPRGGASPRAPAWAREKKSARFAPEHARGPSPAGRKTPTSGGGGARSGRKAPPPPAAAGPKRRVPSPGHAVHAHTAALSSSSPLEGGVKRVPEAVYRSPSGPARVSNAASTSPDRQPSAPYSSPSSVDSEPRPSSSLPTAAPGHATPVVYASMAPSAPAQVDSRNMSAEQEDEADVPATTITPGRTTADPSVATASNYAPSQNARSGSYAQPAPAAAAAASQTRATVAVATDPPSTFSAASIYSSSTGATMTPAQAAAAAQDSAEQGLQLFRRWGCAAADLSSLSVRRCALTPKLVIGSEQRVATDLAVCEVVWPAGGLHSTSSGAAAATASALRPSQSARRAACVAAAYTSNAGMSASARNRAATATGRTGTATVAATQQPALGLGETSMTTLGDAAAGASVSGFGATGVGEGGPAAMLMSDLPCSEFGYQWGSTPASAAQQQQQQQQQHITGGYKDEYSSPLAAAAMAASRAPGLVMAWIVLPTVTASEREEEEERARAQEATGGTGVVTDGASNAAGARRRSSTSAVNTMEGAPGAVSATGCVVVAAPLVCDSEVISLLAHPFHPSVLLAGTRSGRIVLWDLTLGEWHHMLPRQAGTRALATTGSATVLLQHPQRPTLSFFPSPQAHQGPVLRLAIFGDRNCHHLYSVSQDGRVCVWPALQPVSPVSSRSAYVGSKPLGNTATAAVFTNMKGTDAMTQVFIGTSDGDVLSGVNRDKNVLELRDVSVKPPRRSEAPPLSNSLLLQLDTFASPPSLAMGATTMSGPSASSIMAHHTGVVSVLSAQPRVGAGASGEACVASAATDGSCIAWVGESSTRLEGFATAVTALCWSPTHPHMFAAGDASGVLSFWNITRSLAVPVAAQQLRTPLSAVEDTTMTVLSMCTADGAGVGATIGASSPTQPSDPAGGVGRAGLGLGGTSSGDGAAHGGWGDVGEASATITSIVFAESGRWVVVGNASGAVFVIELAEHLCRQGK